MSLAKAAVIVSWLEKKTKKKKITHLLFPLFIPAAGWDLLHPSPVKPVRNQREYQKVHLIIYLHMIIVKILKEKCLFLFWFSRVVVVVRFFFVVVSVQSNTFLPFFVTCSFNHLPTGVSFPPFFSCTTSIQTRVQVRSACRNTVLHIQEVVGCWQPAAEGNASEKNRKK